MTGPLLDCIVIGGGPAGLTAALYLARFRRKVCVIDAGESRAAWIPVSHNQPLFPAGISGTEILGRMREHLTHLGTEILADKAIAVARIDQGFLVELTEETAAARTLLLATGVVNHQPDMNTQIHRDAVAAGLIRYCPICDGFEAKDQKIVVLGRGTHGVREALFLRTYSRDVTLFCDISALDDCSSRQLVAAGISVIEQPVACLTVDQAKILIETASGACLRFDTLYPALGSSSNTDLFLSLGGSLSSEGCIPVNSHQMTNVQGLCAAGDVVQGLDQISVACGQAAIAATAIHNRLRDLDGFGDPQGLKKSPPRLGASITPPRMETSADALCFPPDQVALITIRIDGVKQLLLAVALLVIGMAIGAICLLRQL